MAQEVITFFAQHLNLFPFRIRFRLRMGPDISYELPDIPTTKVKIKYRILLSSTFLLLLGPY